MVEPRVACKRCTGAIVIVTIAGAPSSPWKEDRAKHPKNPDIGTKAVTFANKVFVEQADARTIQEGEEITLMGWGNVIIKGILQSANGAIERLEAERNLGGDFSKTKKVHWLAAEGAQNSATQLWEFDYLLTKDSLTKTDDLAQCLNPVTATMVDALVGVDCEGLVEGDIIQLERKGYFRVDKAIGKGPDGKAVMFKIPTGTSKV